MTNHKERLIGGRYKIIQELSRGAFGITYIAEDRLEKMRCVVKELDPISADVETAKRLFKREASILQGLQTIHHIPQYLNYVEEGGKYYLIEEYINGKNLGNLLNRKWSKQEVVKLLMQVLWILKCLHEQNIIHRDIKPSNLIKRNEDNNFVMIDFGSVKQIDSAYLYNQQMQSLHSTVIFSRGYAPPEQIEGKPRLNSDIYALGMTAIQCLTGINPAQLQRDQNGNVILNGVDPGLIPILTKMVDLNPEERYQSVEQVFHDVAFLPDSYRTEIQLPDTHLQTNKQQGFKISQTINSPRINSQSISQNSDNQFEISKNNRRTIDLPTIKYWQIPALIAAVGAIVVCIELVNPFIRPAYYWHEANRLLDRRKPEKAFQKFEKLKEITPKSARAWKGLGDALFTSGHRYEKALAYYERAIDLKPDYQKALINKGRVLYQIGNYKQALTTYDRVLKIDLDNTEALSGKGIAYLGLREYAKASDYFTKVKQLEPDEPKIWYNIGLAVEQLQEPKTAKKSAKAYFEEAVSSYDALLKKNPKDWIGWTDRGSVLLKLNRPEDALKSYQKALKYHKNFYEGLMGKGNTLTIIGKHQEALEVFNQASEIRPEDYLVWYNRGQILARNLNKHEEALQSFNKAIRRRNNFYPAWLGKGLALLELQRYDEALIAFDKAKDIEPNNPLAWANRGYVLGKLGRNQEARDSYNQAVRLGYPREKLTDIK
ncbi:MAG: tetratricopeptide repeat protein [Calothrix sp. MO_192.B10]|nr:tetratricopeptide repeat protein [Calothrix sp. MO_192.B10]